MAPAENFVRTEADMKDFLDNGEMGLHWVASDGTILWANRADYEPLGYSREEYIGQDIRKFHVDANVIQDILTKLSSGEKLHGYRARLRAKDGAPRNALITSSVLFDQSGKFVHTRCFTMLAPEEKGASPRA
jgi:PAS domain S-box-containing protein